MRYFSFLFITMTLVFSGCSKNEDIGTLTNVNSLEEFNNTLDSGVSLMFFHASWCTLCQDQRPAIEALVNREDVKSAKIAQVDYEVVKEVVNAYGITGFPTIVFYKDGIEKNRLNGKGHTEEELAAILKSLF
ncbi:MAG: thioredoxin family protein [Saprospiraceae bacterium]